MRVCHSARIVLAYDAEMLDLLNPTPTQKLIERELLFGTRDVCCIGTARAGKGVAAVKSMVLRSQMHRELGIGSGDYSVDSPKRRCHTSKLQVLFRRRVSTARL